MLTEEYQKLVVKSPSPELAKNIQYIQYMDFVEIDRDKVPVADIDEIWAVLEDQCEESLKEVKKIRGEIPVAIQLFTMPHPENKRYTQFGWKAWVKKP